MGALLKPFEIHVDEQTYPLGRFLEELSPRGYVCQCGYLCLLAIAYGLLHSEAFKTQKSIGNGIGKELRTGTEDERRLKYERSSRYSSAALNQLVRLVGCVMAVPTTTAQAPASIAARASAGVCT